MIPKVDAHHHLWSFAAARHYPLLTAPSGRRFYGKVEGLQHDFDPAAFAALARPCGVVKSVYVEAGFAPPEQEVAFVQAWADHNPFPTAIIGRADLASPSLGARLDADMAHAAFRGLRVMVNWDADPLLRSASRDGLLRDPAWRAGYAELGRRGLVAEVMALPAQLLDLADLARRSPQTLLVVGHAGLPMARSPEETALWREGLTALAAAPHAAVKISGLGMADHGWTLQSITPIVREVIDLFGPDRCMFASNFPVDGLHASYARIWEAFETVVHDGSDADPRCPVPRHGDTHLPTRVRDHTAMATFLLIHGAWHGGWCWAPVEERLRARGHAVLAPDLPGMDPTAAPGIATLDGWARFVADLAAEVGERVILVGHSRGGAVISQAAEEAPERIQGLVYVTALLLPDGGHVMGLGAHMPADAIAAIRPSADGATSTLDPAAAAEILYNTTPPHLAGWAVERLGPDPTAPNLAPLTLSPERYGAMPRAYVECARDHIVTPELQRLMQAALPCDPVVTLDCDHSPFLSAPDALADALNAAASAFGRSRAPASS